MATNEQLSKTPAVRPSGSEIRRVANLALGDILAFLVFALIGSNSHKEAVTAGHVVWVAVPFVVAWFLVAPFLGAYRRNLDVRAMAVRTGISWLAAWPVSMLLRGLLVDHQVPPLTFMVIALIANFIILCIWRIPYAIVRGKVR
ncbi:MAG TPA: DUF3054 domain-containing protein [Ktedonobacteraceae bacterium]|nr:DUF3054 domain-containing protein [Ktedonobacteraceae bacterium]